MLITNHESLADVISIALISNKLTGLVNKARGVDDSLGKMILNDLKEAYAGNLLGERPAEKKAFPGFVLTIAKSLEAGGKGQGEFIEELTRQLRSWLRDNSVQTDGYVRKKDEEKYHLSRTNMGYLRRFINSIENGEGRAMFPQASVESGRMLMENNNGNDILDGNLKLNKKMSKFAQGALKGLSLIAKELVRSTLPEETYLSLGKIIKDNTFPIKGAQKFDEEVRFDEILKITHDIISIFSSSSSALSIPPLKATPPWKTTGGRISLPEPTSLK